ncbi:MAG: OsmC family protein [Bacteroidota bacterium]
MDSTELRQLQAPLKEKYRQHPASALVTLKAQGQMGEGISCKVETGRALVEAGLHPATGGSGILACSGDLLLEALVACAGVTLRAVATAIGVEIKNGFVKAEGDLDFRGTLGVAKDVPVGFRTIRLQFVLESNATAEQMDSIAKLTERYCVVYQTLTKGVEIETQYHSS